MKKPNGYYRKGINNMLKFMKTRSEFFMDEKDVTTVVAVINRHTRYARCRIGNCGWADESTKWFVMFDCTDKVHRDIVKDLTKIGRFKLDVRPGGQMDLCFERG